MTIAVNYVDWDVKQQTKPKPHQLLMSVITILPRRESVPSINSLDEEIRSGTDALVIGCSADKLSNVVLASTFYNKNKLKMKYYHALWLQNSFHAQLN